MRYHQGTLYLETSDVLTITGLTRGQLSGAIHRGLVSPIQKEKHHMLLFDVADSIDIARSVYFARRIKTSRIRKKPVYDDLQGFRNIVYKLDKCGYDVSVLNLILDDIKWKCEENSPAEQEERESQQRSPLVEGPEAVVLGSQRPKLPFVFRLGSLRPLTPSYDIGEVEHCFGYADETNPKCQGCPALDECAYLRFEILSLIEDAIREGHTQIEKKIQQKRVDFFHSNF